MRQSAPPHLRHFIVHLENTMWCTSMPKALIFKKSDVEDLREKLQDACDHPEMVMKMKNQTADFICEKYNWDEVVKRNNCCTACVAVGVYTYYR